MSWHQARLGGRQGSGMEMLVKISPKTSPSHLFSHCNNEVRLFWFVAWGLGPDAISDATQRLSKI